MKVNRDPLLKIYDNALLLTVTRHGGQAKIYMQSSTRKALTFINFVGWDFSEVISEDARKAGVGLAVWLEPVTAKNPTTGAR